MSNHYLHFAASIAEEIYREDREEFISEYIDRELMNYSTAELVALCQQVQGEKYVFTNPPPDLSGDFDHILKQLAHNTLNFMIIKEIYRIVNG